MRRRVSQRFAAGNSAKGVLALRNDSLDVTYEYTPQPVTL